MKKILLAGSILVLLTGCVTNQQREDITSGEIGCAPNQIKISNNQTSEVGSTWTAECNNEKYYCSLTMSQGTIDTTSCKKAQ